MVGIPPVYGARVLSRAGGGTWCVYVDVGTRQALCRCGCVALGRYIGWVCCTPLPPSSPLLSQPRKFFISGVVQPPPQHCSARETTPCSGFVCAWGNSKSELVWITQQMMNHKKKKATTKPSSSSSSSSAPVDRRAELEGLRHARPGAKDTHSPPQGTVSENNLEQF